MFITIAAIVGAILALAVIAVAVLFVVGVYLNYLALKVRGEIPTIEQAPDDNSQAHSIPLTLQPQA
jgi:cell division protein FtsL